MCVTKSVFKLILVLSNYQTCAFPLALVHFKKLTCSTLERVLSHQAHRFWSFKNDECYRRSDKIIYTPHAAPCLSQLACVILRLVIQSTVCINTKGLSCVWYYVWQCQVFNNQWDHCLHKFVLVWFTWVTNQDWSCN